MAPCPALPLLPANPTLLWHWTAGLAKHWEKLFCIHTNYVTAEVRHKNVKEYRHKIWWHQREEKINFPYSEQGIIQCCWRRPASWSCHFPGSGYHSDFHTRHVNTPWCHLGASTGHGQLVPPAEHYNIYNLDCGKIHSHQKRQILLKLDYILHIMESAESCNEPEKLQFIF